MDWEGRLPLSSNRAGPFVSALTHVVLQLGQKPIALPNSHLDGGGTNGKRKADLGDNELEANGVVCGRDWYQPCECGLLMHGWHAMDHVKRSRPNSGNNRKGKAAKPRASVTLKDLVDLSVILPGRNKISVSYKGVNYVASLGKDGIIVYQGKKFGSATAFSIHCKRMQTPNKQGDDGWKSTMYEGQPLENYRRKYFQDSGLDAEDAEEDTEEQTQQQVSHQSVPQQQQQQQQQQPQAQPQQQEPAETDHWVQCDRCRTWRIVPDASWPAVEADTRDSWFCEWATWDVRLSVPHNPPCMQRA